jgi:hypothetical protein
MSPAPEHEPQLFKPSLCPQKQQLFEALKTAIGDVLNVNGRLMEAIIEGKAEKVEAITAELHVARDRKDTLITAYTHHLREHGC